MLTVEGAGIGRELAYWEGSHRFAEVELLLQQHLGRRFAGMTPTKNADVYLLGDRRPRDDVRNQIFPTTPRP